MRYRFRRADIMNLVDMVDDNVSVAERKGSLTPTLQVLIALRFFACGSFQLVVGDLFGVSKATISRTIHRGPSGCSLRSTCAETRSLPPTTRDGSHESRVPCRGELSKRYWLRRLYAR